MTYKTLTSEQKISYQEDGSPFSTQFNDIYFDTESGYQQSLNVFVHGNQLSDRLLTHHGSSSFTIGETGFGTGLNFLLTLQLYTHLLTEHNTLPVIHFISVEKYPLTKQQLIQSLKALPQLAIMAEELIKRYPKTVTDDLTINFLKGKITLTLLIGDATERFSTFNLPTENKVNAWFLDGFSPAKNPDMWQPSLYNAMVAISQPQATLATFTVAGKVRRELQQAGFRIEKRPIHGKKKEILFGQLQQTQVKTKGYYYRPERDKPQQVTIIGGGISAACAAYSLTKKGIKVVVYCKDDNIAKGASSNAIGALYPLLHQKRDDISNFYETAFYHAKARYQQLIDNGYHFAHQWCGLLEVSYKKALEKRQQAFEQYQAWPEQLITSIDANTANNIAGIPLNLGGLFMPHAGWICPPELVQQMFKAAKDTGRLRLKKQSHITSISQNNDQTWSLNTASGYLHTPVLIYCGGAEGININIINELPLQSVRGQVSSVTVTDFSQNINTVICHKGYLTPQYQNQHCIGATFEKDSFNTTTSEQDDIYNLTMLNDCLPQLPQWQLHEVVTSKARLRCTTPDHMPIVGAMPNIASHKKQYSHLAKDKNWRYDTRTPTIKNLYLLTGLGARGLVSAPLLADILAAELTNTPYPVSDDMLFNLSPNRFIIRDIIKRKVKV